MENKPILIVIAGPNGSGKTSITSKIISRYGKSITNAIKIATIADRAYFYDNSINNEDAKLLFRLSDGNIYKKYYSLKPYTWAKSVFGFFEKDMT